MSADNTPLAVSTSNESTGASQKSEDRIAIRVILVLAAFTVIPLLVSAFVEATVPAHEVASIAPELSPADYYPRQYQGAAQGAMPEEHIQAF